MLYNFMELDRSSHRSLTFQLYEALRDAIESRYFEPGENLLSIRQASSELGLSRTTIENAYQRLLLEGYVESRPQSGYKVRAVIPRRRDVKVESIPAPIYDFTTHGMDPEDADLVIWRKMLKKVLTDVKAVSTYGDAQGEPELREALSSYSFRARGVATGPDRIFIGAGTGPLLQLLCPLLDRNMPLVIEDPGFPLLERIFSDYGVDVKVVPSDGDYPDDDCCMLASLPSMRPRHTAEENLRERNILKSWLSETDGRYLLEDDYNGELRYRTRPLSSFQAILPERTIYIGSFSKLLLPSVRIAYMVLPEELAARARERLSDLNQTAGKTEQLALAEYIESGYLEKHLKRLRRIYQRKSQRLEALIEKVFGEVEYELLETSLSFAVHLDQNVDVEELTSKAISEGIAIRKAPGMGNGILLGFSTIAEEDMETALSRLAEMM